MDDRQIEERLRRAFPAGVPEGLREDVLRAARRARAQSARRPAAGRLRWAAAVAAALLWTAAAVGMDSAREARMERLILRNAPPGITVAHAVARIRQERESYYRGGTL